MAARDPTIGVPGGYAAAATALLGVGSAPRDPALDPIELAAWTATARAVLNLHEAIARY